MSQSVLAADVSLLWIGARSTGVAAWLFASATVLFGLMIRTHSFGTKISVRTTSIVHRTLAAVTVVVALLHVSLLLPDPYADLSLLDVVAPWRIERDRLATSLGIIALWLLVMVGVAGLVRTRLRRRTWTVVHALAFAVWPLATMHFILQGTDAMTPWALGSVALVGFLLLESLLLRGFADRRANRRRVTSPARPAGDGGAVTPTPATALPAWSAPPVVGSEAEPTPALVR